MHCYSIIQHFPRLETRIVTQFCIDSLLYVSAQFLTLPRGPRERLAMQKAFRKAENHFNQSKLAVFAVACHIEASFSWIFLEKKYRRMKGFKHAHGGMWLRKRFQIQQVSSIGIGNCARHQTPRRPRSPRKTRPCIYPKPISVRWRWIRWAPRWIGRNESESVCNRTAEPGGKMLSNS